METTSTPTGSRSSWAPCSRPSRTATRRADFTHKRNDTVRISTPDLGELVNRVRYCDEIAPWNFGTGALIRNLAQRGLL